MSNDANKPAAGPSALSALKALAAKKPAPAGSPAVALQVSDPAIAGAKLTKNTVKLGVDPGFVARAQYAASLHGALERAQADFSVAQAEMRDYGLAKREIYNDAFRANVTTVCVPYFEHLDDIGDGRHAAAQGQEARWVQVICSHRYSVQQETVLQNRDRLGEAFGRLFKVEETKALKPNAEELLLGVFRELGIDGEQLETTMAQLFDTKVKVSATEQYEAESKKLPEETRALLSQMVTRAAPGLKFPD